MSIAWEIKTTTTYQLIIDQDQEANALSLDLDFAAEEAWSDLNADVKQFVCMLLLKAYYKGVWKTV